MIRYFSLVVIMCLAGVAFGQRHFTLDGYVVDKTTGDAISGARISINKRHTEAFSNRYGYFSVYVPTREIEVTVEFEGYFKNIFKLDIEGNVSQKIELEPIQTSDRPNVPNSSSQNALSDPLSSKIDVPVNTLKEVPFLFSENDVVKGLQLLPGVDFGVNGTSDLIVRGGDVGQNLMLLDGTPVLSQGHYFGYISNFNTGIINNIQVYKGAATARYGGRVSSIIDITSSSGSKEDVEASVSINPILINLNIGVPLGENGNSSATFNWRRSYIDILFGGLISSDALSFGDIQTKYDFKLTDKDRLIVSYYQLKDKLGLSFDATDSSGATYDLSYVEKNHTGSLRWNHIYSNTLFSSVSASYSGLTTSEKFVEHDNNPVAGAPARIENNANFYSGDLALNWDLEKNYSINHLLRFGSQNILHTFTPGKFSEVSYDLVNTVIKNVNYGYQSSLKAIELSQYIEDEWKVNEYTKINFGMRTTLYSHDGFTRFYPEPRIAGRRIIDSVSTFKFSFTRMNQYVHLFNNGSTDGEIIAYLPANDRLKPQNSNQITIGYVRKINAHVQWMSDLYFKTLGNQVVFYSQFADDDLTQNSLVGKGKCYGFENWVKVNMNNLSIWLSYNLAVSNRTFDDLNRGQPFSFDFDRRNNFKYSMVFTQDRWILSMNIIALSGNPYTLPNAKYLDIDGRVVLSYDEINNYRSKAYFRSDIKLQYFWGYYDDKSHCIEFMVYNLTANPNISNIYSALDKTASNQKYSAYKESQFVFFPSVSYKLTI
ncbi:MAG: TonB-dependent receptor plug domain-containing protein [Bacteroidetes bacterium]|nr:TonB-dependent receptor plug domain-containing protein [Bacteroidota bacterium]